MKRILHFAYGLLLVSGLGAQVGPCRIPGQGQPTFPTKPDWVNKNIATDYYALALSWSPGFCTPERKSRATRWQCEENVFGWVVHGLWPQSARATSSQEHPRNCGRPEILAPEVTKPFLCILPGAQLAQDQWVKHGSCAWPDATSYFRQIEKLYNSLVMRDPPARRVTAKAVKDSFVAANASRGLRAEHVQVRVRPRNEFSELLICYDKNFRFQGCPAGGTPDDVQVWVQPRRR